MEDGVDDDKLLLSAKLQQQAPFVVAVTNAMSAKHSFPGIYILAHSNIEITKDYYLVICRDALETAAELRVAYCLFFRGRRMDIMRSEWPVSRFSSLEAMEVLTMKPTPERCPTVLSFPDQRRVYSAPCSWRLPSLGKRTSLRAAMSTFNLNSLCAIRAERRSDRLLWAASSMVMTLQHATFSIFAFLEIGAYLPCFNVLGLLKKMPVDRGKPTGGWETSFG